MTFVERIFLRLVQIYSCVFVAAWAYSAFVDGPTGGAVMAVMVLSAPVLILGSVAVFKLIDVMSSEPEPFVARSDTASDHAAVATTPPKKRFFQDTGALLSTGLFGVVCVAALLIWGSLVGRHPTWPEKLLFVAIIAALSVPGFMICAKVETFAWLRARRTQKQATTLVERGDMSSARALLLEMKDSNPKYFMSWALASWGYSLFNERLPQLESAQRAVDAVKYRYTELARGVALNSIGAYPEAIIDLSSAVKTKVPGTLPLLGTALLSAGNPNLGVETLQLSAERGELLGKFCLADAYFSLGRIEEQRALLREISGTNPKASSPDRAVVAYALALLGKYESAEPLARECLEIPYATGTAIAALLFAYAGGLRIDDAYRYAVALALTNPAATCSCLADSRLAHLMTEQRFRDLLASCERVRDREVAIAHRIIAANAA